jgi:hypothetical protein
VNYEAITLLEWFATEDSELTRFRSLLEVMRNSATTITFPHVSYPSDLGPLTGPGPLLGIEQPPVKKKTATTRNY